MRLIVFNVHTNRTRETILRPDDGWGGSGLLGITIRFDIVHSLDNHVLHVLDVYEDSPASASGLDGFNDYLLGVGDLIFDGPDDFGEIVQYARNYEARTPSHTLTPCEAARPTGMPPRRSRGGAAAATGVGMYT